MKNILISILFFSLTAANAQTVNDSIYVSKQLIIDASTRIKNLEVDLGISNSQILNLKKQITAMENLNMQNETILDYKNKELEIYKNAVNRFIDFPTKPKDRWYETKHFNFVAGALIGGFTIFSGAWIVSTIR